MVICPSVAQPWAYPMAPSSSTSTRGRAEGDVHDREEQVAQGHRVALGLAGHLDVVVAAVQRWRP